MLLGSNYMEVGSESNTFIAEAVFTRCRLSKRYLIRY